ncbi:MAG: C40 family peptidase [Cyanobacteria bacterium J06592_8]
MNFDPILDIVEYRCTGDLNLYDSIDCKTLTTQACTGRHLRVRQQDLDNPLNRQAIQVELCEDDYPGWLAIADLDRIELAKTLYQFQSVSEAEIQSKLPAVIAFSHKAMNVSNSYLWGGTVGPDYDCSGLIQTAFASQGIWLPRDAHQQEAFTEDIIQNTLPNHTQNTLLDQIQAVISCLQIGDLIFFGTHRKATHVGLYLGQGRYIHSSSSEKGRNGIGIDVISDQGDRVSQEYYQQLRGAGRVVRSYHSGAESIFYSED